MNLFLNIENKYFEWDKLKGKGEHLGWDRESNIYSLINTHMSRRIV